MSPEQRRAHLFFLALLVVAGLMPRETLLAELELAGICSRAADVRPQA